MNNIGSNLNAYGRRYSQQTIEGGKKFYNFIEKVHKDSYNKNQEEIAKGTNIFLNFIKKVRLDALRQSVERHNIFVQPKPIKSVKEVVVLTLDADAPSSTQPQLSSQQQKDNTIGVTQHPLNIKQNQVGKFRLNQTLNGEQIQYLDNMSRKLLEELNKEKSKIIANGYENRHVVSDNELKALVHIVFCQKFCIKNENTKELERRVIDIDNNRDGKKISRITAKNYCNIIQNLINKNTGKLYYIQGSSIGELKLNKMNSFVLKELKDLNKLKNT